MNPRDFPDGFRLKRTDHLFKRPGTKFIGAFPLSFQFNELALMLIAEKLRQPYVQN